MQGLLARTRVEWKDIHRALAKHGLELHKAEQGGYTVQATGTELRCKASDVFRRSFAGKASREATEKKLGPWQAATADDRVRPAFSIRYEKRAEATAKRQEQRDAREQARAKLKKRFGAYRIELRSEQRKYMTLVKVKRDLIATSLKDTKKLIRSEGTTWVEKRARLSQAVARSVTAQRLLKAEVMQGRMERQGLTYQAWVIHEAQAGDLAAASQLRGWRYTDQRNINKADVLMNSQVNAVHLSSGADTKDKDSEYAGLMNSRLRELRRNEELAKSLAAARWTINRRTGDVQYAVGGVLHL
jgi:ribosomal protein L7/L12